MKRFFASALLNVALLTFTSSCLHNANLTQIIDRQSELDKTSSITTPKTDNIQDKDQLLIDKTAADSQLTIDRKADEEYEKTEIENLSEVQKSQEGQQAEGMVDKTSVDNSLSNNRKLEAENGGDYAKIIMKNEEIASQKSVQDPQEGSVYRVDDADFNEQSYKFGSLKLQYVPYSELKKWGDSYNFHLAKVSFLNLCKFVKSRDVSFKNALFDLGKSADYLPLCKQIDGLHRNSDLREFFEKNFTPFSIFDLRAGSERGMFTGYYRIEMQGCLQRTAHCKYPVYKRPGDLVAGQKHYSRAQIYDGALRHKNLEIIWLKDIADHYLLHIQGTGIVHLDNGKKIFLSFDGKNGHEYSSVANYARQNGFGGSGMNFYDWMRADTQRAESILSYNKSYIFFKPSNHMDVIGGSGMALMPFASLAVDTNFIPYGAIMYLATEKTPYTEDGINGIFMAQDTGSDIKGAIRGDIYFGSGQNADFMAHRTKVHGSYFLLMPNFAPSIKELIANPS